jgi:hypothetical protein
LRDQDRFGHRYGGLNSGAHRLLGAVGSVYDDKKALCWPTEYAAAFLVRIEILDDADQLLPKSANPFWPSLFDGQLDIP